MNTIIIQITLQSDKKSEWQTLLNSAEGIALTSKQKGFISAEYGFTTNDAGDLVWNLWEKWEAKEDYDNYNAIPERLEDSKFMQTFVSVMAGAPTMLWLDDVKLFKPAH